MAEKEYIEREAALPAQNKSMNLSECRKRLESIPAADVRPVVYCKDCKRYGGRPWENNESGICARTDSGVGEFDFCSYGEKMEES